MPMFQWSFSLIVKIASGNMGAMFAALAVAFINSAVHACLDLAFGSKFNTRLRGVG